MKGSVRRLEVKSVFQPEALAEEGNDFLAFAKVARTSDSEKNLSDDAETHFRARNHKDLYWPKQHGHQLIMGYA